MENLLFELETPHVQGASPWSTMGRVCLCILFNVVISAPEGFGIIAADYMTQAQAPAFMLLPKLQHRKALSSLINEQL